MTRDETKKLLDDILTAYGSDYIITWGLIPEFNPVFGIEFREINLKFEKIKGATE